MLFVLLLPLLVAGAHATQQPAENTSVDDTYDEVFQDQHDDDHGESALYEVQNDNSENLQPFTDWIQKTWEQFGFWTPPSATKDVDLKPPDSCEPCSCGLTNEEVRIVGGTITKVMQYPWTAMLIFEGTFYCGGSLISDKYVLTAAHCLNGLDQLRMRVRLLEHDRDDQSETSVIERRVLRVRLHRHYNSDNYNNDIGLIRLSEPVKLEGKTRPVCMPTKGLSFAGEQGLVVGWGITQQFGDTSLQLREVTVPIMSNSKCRKTSYGEQRITDNMICAGYPDGKKDACQGDSGGSLNVKNGTQYHIAGVVSWGYGCGLPNYPGVYTRVNRYMTWIYKNTIDSCFCN